MPHTGYMNKKMSRNSPAAASILNPHPLLGQRDAAGNHRVMVYTDSDSRYLTVSDMLDLAAEGSISITDVDSSGLPGQYERTHVSYIIN